MKRAEAYRLYIEWAIRQPRVTGKPISFCAAANKLNERNTESSMGGRWTGQQLLRMGLRLGLRIPPRRLTHDGALAQVHAIWGAQSGSYWEAGSTQFRAPSIL